MNNCFFFGIYTYFKITIYFYFSAQIMLDQITITKIAIALCCWLFVMPITSFVLWILVHMADAVMEVYLKEKQLWRKIGGRPHESFESRIYF